MKVLIIGLGIGRVYEEQCKALGYNVFTLDINRHQKPTYTASYQAKHQKYDIVIICCPNQQHEYYIDEFYKLTPIILVEKPGLKDSATWINKCEQVKPTKLIMVKNNLYRNFDPLRKLLPAKRIDILWITKNRVPHPGSWFTTRSKAWGGVSYDLMPHLLCFMLGFGWKHPPIRMQARRFQKYNLKTIVDSDYGVINRDGIYDVDDHCHISYFAGATTTINLLAAWKNDEFPEDRQEMHILGIDGTMSRYRFGLCPNAVYGNMIQAILYEHQTDENSYSEHLRTDKWILDQLSVMSPQQFTLKEVLK